MDPLRDRLPRRLTKPELAVFVSGITSMGLQILAIRIIAPQYGTSIYTTGSIITVFLAALSLGYWRGGDRAASHATPDRLLWLLLFTAVYVAIVIFGRDLLVTTTATINVDPRYASLPAVIVLFGPPTYLLGFISPYAAELSHKQGVGEASGHVYAVGTIGSILGTGGTTFFLIPALNVDEIGLFFGALLVGTALAISLPSPRRRHVGAIGAVSILLLASVGAPAMGFTVHGEVVYETQTPYQSLEVVDRGDTRTLWLDGAQHSAMDLDEPNRHVFTYTRYFHLPYLYADEPDDVERVLFIGGGGYTGPKSFLERDENVTVDVVEIDPEVTETAREYFGLDAYADSDRLTIHTEDGRTFLRETDETYDVIVLDAFKKDTAPFHMTTEEFFELTHDRLREDGTLVANVISAPSGPASEFYRAEYRTMGQVYPQVYAFPTSESYSIQNIQLIASADGERITEAELRERNAARDVGIDLSDEVETYESDVDTDGAPVLRDDDAPVDSLLDPQLGQQYVVEETDDGSAGNDSTAPATVPSIGGF